MNALVGRDIRGTMKAPCSKACCGCLNLLWVSDEQAWKAVCNECGEEFGWFKADWTGVEDRMRLGGDPTGICPVTMESGSAEASGQS